MAYLEYSACPFSDGALCTVHPDSNGRPQHECIRIVCPVWEVIQELDESGMMNAQDAEELEKQVFDLTNEITILKSKTRSIKWLIKFGIRLSVAVTVVGFGLISLALTLLALRRFG